MSYIRPQAVIVVDVQADFTEYRCGALAVPGTGPDYLEQVVARTRASEGSSRVTLCKQIVYLALLR